MCLSIVQASRELTFELFCRRAVIFRASSSPLVKSSAIISIWNLARTMFSRRGYRRMEIKFSAFYARIAYFHDGVYDSRDPKRRVRRFRHVECELLRLFGQSFGKPDRLVTPVLAIDVK